MKKVNKTYNEVMSIVNSSGLPFSVLNENNGVFSHIRVAKDGEKIDIWPATGTFLKDKKHNRKDIDGIRIALLNEAKKPKVDLLERIIDLEEYCAHLEHEISLIKERL